MGILLKITVKLRLKSQNADVSDVLFKLHIGGTNGAH